MQKTLLTPHIYNVSGLTQAIREELEEQFGIIWLEGEVSNMRVPSSGHFYFTLKDKESQIKVVLFRSWSRYLKFSIKDGMQLLVRGKLSVYARRGEYQLVAEYAEPKGLGALQLAFEELKRKLYAEGLFDPAHKQVLPLLPSTIGLVTSPTGAAIRDILQIIGRRFPNVRIIVNPVRVQGEGAAREIVQALEELNRFPEPVDIIILTRGGGSLEDLWCFNEEIVARAVFASHIPVISAVGHEIDYTISDFVADLRAPTPSAAAELVVENKEALLANLQSLHIRLQQGIRSALDNSRYQLQILTQNRFLADPLARILEWEQQIDDLRSSLEYGIKVYLNQLRFRAASSYQQLQTLTPSHKLEELKFKVTQNRERLNFLWSNFFSGQKAQLEASLARLHTLSPLAILARGYSICRRLPKGEIITSTEQVQAGDRVSVKLSQGNLLCKVNQKEQ